MEHVKKHAFFFFLGTLFSRFGGLFRDLSLAIAFGTHHKIATFMVAYRLSLLLRRLLGEGGVSAIFIPHFQKLKQQSKKSAYLFFDELKRSLIYSCFLIIFCLMALFYTLFIYDKDPLFLFSALLMPSLLFVVLYSLNQAFLQCENKFFITSLSPLFFNITIALSALFLSLFPLDQALKYLTLCLIIAAFFQFLPSYLMVKKTSLIYKEEFSLSYSAFTENVSALKKPFILSLIGISATQINSFLDPFFARSALLEGPAYLWYAIRLQQAPLALFGIAITSAITPKFQDHQNIEKLLKYGQQKLLVIMGSICCLFFLFTQEIVTLTFGYGAFQQSSIIGTSDCLKGYVIGLIPMGAILLITPAFYALKDYKTPTRATVISLIINILLNTAAIFIFNKGPYSVAYTTSIAAFVQLIYLKYQLQKVLKSTT